MPWPAGMSPAANEVLCNCASQVLRSLAGISPVCRRDVRLFGAQDESTTNAVRCRIGGCSNDQPMKTHARAVLQSQRKSYAQRREIDWVWCSDAIPGHQDMPVPGLPAIAGYLSRLVWANSRDVRRKHVSTHEMQQLRVCH